MVEGLLANLVSSIKLLACAALENCSLVLFSEDLLVGALVEGSIEEDFGNGVNLVLVLLEEGLVDFEFNEAKVVEVLEARFQFNVGFQFYGLHVNLFGGLEDAGEGKVLHLLVDHFDLWGFT